MRLIDADALMAELEKTEKAMSKEAEIKGMRLARFIVGEAKEVDAVCVVRCKECRYYEPLDESRPFDCYHG